MAKITLGEIYSYAKTSTSYTAFMAELGQWLDIPPTDTRCNDITLQDLCNEKLDKYLKNKYPIKRGTSQKNCNKAIRSRQFFKEGYLFAMSERGENISSETDIKVLRLPDVVGSYSDNDKQCIAAEQYANRGSCRER